MFSCCFLVTLFSLICVRFCFSSSPSDLFFRLNSGRSLDYLEPCYLSMQSSCKFTMLGIFFGYFYTNIIHVLLENDFWIFILISSMYCIVAFHTNAIHVQCVFEDHPCVFGFFLLASLFLENWYFGLILRSFPLNFLFFSKILSPILHWKQN